MRQAEDKDNVLDKFNLIDLEIPKGTTGAKELRMFKRSFEKSFSVQTAHFKPNLLAFLNDQWIKWGCVSKSFLDSVGVTKFKNEFGLSFLQNKKGQELGTNINEAMSLNHPFIYPSFMSRVLLKDRTFVLLRSAIEIGKVFIQPIHQLFSRIGNIENRAKVGSLVSVIFGRIDSVNAERSFAIDDTGKISQFKRFINDFSVLNIMHFPSKVMRADYSTLAHLIPG